MEKKLLTIHPTKKYHLTVFYTMPNTYHTGKVDKRIEITSVTDFYGKDVLELLSPGILLSFKFEIVEKESILDNYKSAFKQNKDDKFKNLFSLKLTKEVLVKLGFKNKGSIWTKWLLDLREDEPNCFSFKGGRIYFDIETVGELYTFWKTIKAEDSMPLPLNVL